MKRARQAIVLAFALTACASPSARAQVGTQATPPVRPNVYEIAPEQRAAAQVAPPQEAPFIEVNGSASVPVPSDRAVVSIAMETRAESAAGAASANANAMGRVLDALRGTRLRGLRLETYGYSVQPQYSTDQQRVRTIVAYAAYNNVRATLDDVDGVGRLIDTAIGAGANRVADVQFMASDPEPARAQALAEAIRNARAQAMVMAEALGYELGPPLEVRGGAQRPGPVMYEAMALRAQAAAPTPIEAGEQNVEANVTVRFALGRELARR